MSHEVARPNDNTESAARFARSVIGWFPDADPPEDWTKQVVYCAKRWPEAVMARAHEALKRAGLRKLPSIPQIEVAMNDAASENAEAARIKAIAERPSPDQLRDRAAALFERCCRRNPLDIVAIVQHGYGGQLYSTLAAAAWRCAQRDCEIAWPDDAAKLLKLKPGPFLPVLPNPSVQPHRIAPDLLAQFNAGARVTDDAEPR